MATTISTQRGQVYIGELPQDFLRITPTQQQQQIQLDAQAAQQLQYGGAIGTVGRLSITVVQVRAGQSGGPKEVASPCSLKRGCEIRVLIRSQVISPCSSAAVSGSSGAAGTENKPLAVDVRREALAHRHWTHFLLLQPLSPGNIKQGCRSGELYPRAVFERRGAHTAVLTLGSVPASMVMQPQPVVLMPTVYQQGVGYVPISGVPAVYSPGMVPVGLPAAPAPPPQPQCTEEDLKALQDMFPNLDREVIRSVLEAQGGSREAAVNSLLQMTEEL
uniref:Toll interacting protein n=1 Tax=Lepisosteus oculatus TaxID=7918 RepID=W5MIP8_LEPOC